MAAKVTGRVVNETGTYSYIGHEDCPDCATAVEQGIASIEKTGSTLWNTFVVYSTRTGSEHHAKVRKVVS